MDYFFSAHEVATLAAEMESRGVVFYKHLQRIAGDTTISNMCAFFAAQEQEHQDKFLAIAEAFRTSESEQCYSVDVCAMLNASMLDLERLLDSKPSPERSLVLVSDGLAIAAGAEATAINVFMKMKDRYTANFTSVLTGMLGEERKHLRMIQFVQARLRPADL